MDYDKDEGRLKLSEGEFAGHEVKSADRTMGQKKECAEEYAESIVGSGKEEDYLAGKENDQLLSSMIPFHSWNFKKAHGAFMSL